MTAIELIELARDPERYVSAAREGEDVLVTEGGVPIVRLMKAESSAEEPRQMEALRKMADQGLLRLGKPGPRPPAPPLIDVPGKLTSQMIIEDRR